MHPVFILILYSSPSSSSIFSFLKGIWSVYQRLSPITPFPPTGSGFCSGCYILNPKWNGSESKNEVSWWNQWELRWHQWACHSFTERRKRNGKGSIRQTMDNYRVKARRLSMQSCFYSCVMSRGDDASLQRLRLGETPDGLIAGFRNLFPIGGKGGVLGSLIRNGTPCPRHFSALRCAEGRCDTQSRTSRW